MNKRVLILVEGQTEERFVKDVLGPVFLERNVYFFPTILATKRVKDGPHFRGGITSFTKFRNDLLRLLGGNRDALVTTMVDYYGLPEDFPGMDSRPIRGTAEQRVAHVENALIGHFGAAANFLPFLALHEFEAWLFASVSELPAAVLEPSKQKEFEGIRNSVNTPEDINERPDLAPSKRILKLFPSYRKTLHGPMVAKRIGLEMIRSECPHFNAWLKKLEAFSD